MIKPRKRGDLFVLCYIRVIGCRVSSLEVVSFPTCPQLIGGTSRNETTSSVRNSHPITQQPKQISHLFFGKFTT